MPRNDDEQLHWFIKHDLKGDDMETANVDDQKHFGVMVGPTGMGKTSIVRQQCHKFPMGVLYYKIVEPKTFTTRLADELDMKISSPNIFDLILSYFSSTFALHYAIHMNQADALDVVMDVLRSASLRLPWQNPTLFMDGADLLSKTEKDTFIRLLIPAKALANEGILTIVLVSSEGSVVPVIQEVSAVSICTRFFEIVDVNDGVAIEYLKKRGLSQKLSEKYVKYVGVGAYI